MTDEQYTRLVTSLITIGADHASVDKLTDQQLGTIAFLLKAVYGKTVREATRRGIGDATYRSLLEPTGLVTRRDQQAEA